MLPGSGLEGSCTAIEMEGILVNYSNIVSRNPLILQSAAPETMAEMHFSLSGQITATNKALPGPVLFSSLEHNLIALSANKTTECIYNGSRQPVVKLEILFSKTFFGQLFHEDCAVHRLIMSKMEKDEITMVAPQHQPISSAMQLLLADIIQVKRKGFYKKLFLESRVLELFMLQTEFFDRSAAQQACHYLANLAGDIEKLYFVKELIDKDPDAAHSLSGLSRQAGLNTFKLKKGFKDVFGETVFGYINELKMQKARRMLLDEKRPVNEVAYLLGYNSPNNFSTAFKKKFGVSPGKIRG
jgi:AraC-like DNA-binding protein